MAMGFQSNPGQASQIFFSTVGQGGEPSRSVAVDSEGVAVTKLQNEVQKQALAQQGANAAADRAVQLQLGMAPINFKRDVFNTVSPLLTGLIGQGNNPQRVGGQSDAPPDITRGPVWSQQQVDERVNAAKASNAANADAQTRQNATTTAGSGFGTRSPLLAALNASTGMQRAAADADTERNIRFDTAKGNADQVTKTDQLALDRWNLAQQQDIQRRQVANNFTSSLAAVLGGLA